jgi:TIR domain/NB-ARC domain
VGRAASLLRWDFFISYTQTDRAWAEWIAWLLEEDGHHVLVQAWDFVAGTNWVQGMQDGVGTASRTIALLSTNYLNSVYGGAEWQAAWAADPRGRGRKLLTVRIDDCPRPGLLGAVVGVDLFDVPETTARARLRAMVSQAVTGRAKPDTPPPFPPTGRAMPREARFPGAMPRVWHVPARNPNFVGRAEALDEMAAALTGRDAAAVVTVRGMGGVGKTQLVNEYAQRNASRYDVVWWIRAEEPASIADQFTQLAAQLGVGSDGDLRRVAGATSLPTSSRGCRRRRSLRVPPGTCW